jgi:hypothetical protein
MIPQSTLDAAARVADHAARRLVVLDKRLLPVQPPDDDPSLVMLGHGPDAGTVESDPRVQHLQGGSGLQRINSA